MCAIITQDTNRYIQKSQEFFERNQSNIDADVKVAKQAPEQGLSANLLFSFVVLTGVLQSFGSHVGLKRLAEGA